MRFLNLLSEIGEASAVILSTHIVEDVEELCSSLAIIDRGEILLAGNGTSFGSTQGTGQVSLGSTYAGSIVSWSNTQIVATVAPGSVTGTAQVQQGACGTTTAPSPSSPRT